MGNTRTMEEAKFTNIDPGTYPVTCIGVRGDTLENPQYGDGAVVKFRLEFDGLEDDEGEPLTREAMASDYLTTGSKLTRYLFAFGISASVGQDIDLDDAIGKQALAVVGKKTKGDKVYDTIDNLIPAPKARTNGSKPAQKAPAASQTPSMIKDTGEVDWPIFWKVTREAGIKREEVIAETENDVDKLLAMDPTDAVALAEILLARHEGVAEGVPFEG
jgi:hypothetical protein